MNLDDPADQTVVDDGTSLGDELRGRDRFPGGAEPLLGPRQRRWAGRAAEFVFNLVFFGVITTLLNSWWSDEPGRADDFTAAGVLIRGGMFALLMLGHTLWKDRKSRREAGGAS